ncbi:MAG: hypothetical protein ACK2U9_26210 [Anaerolineae bacterium]|jgi:hypothetical protein
MSEVYLAIPGAPDKLLGHVDHTGKVYRSQVGPDNEIGHVNLETGRIYEQRFGPDKRVGRVDLGSGKVYTTRLGPDDYVGQVGADGKMHRAQTLAADDYVGKIDPFLSYPHAAGGLLLLVLPALQPAEAPQDAETP